MPAATEPIQAPPAKVLLTDAVQPANVPGRLVLVALGTLLIALFVAGLVITRSTGSETTTTSPAASGSSASATVAGHTQAEATSSATSTTKSVPSEAELLALLGTGVVLVLAGALYSRLSAIKLPGGAEIDLTPEEKTAVATEVAARTAAAAKTTGADYDQLAETTAHALDTALDSARLMKLRSGGTLDTTAIQQSVQVGLHLAAMPTTGVSA